MRTFKDDRRILITNDMISYGEPIGDLGVLNTSHEHFKTNPEHYKLVLFTGGEDVDPKIYGDTSPKGICQYNSNRDIEEAYIFRIARVNNIKMVGICRGAQFLTVMTGGKLMHHITLHAGGRYHEIVCASDTKKVIRVNSLHHQMCLPSKGNYVVGWTPERLSTTYIGRNDEETKYPGPEVEAIIFPSIKSFAVQYHPEMMAPGSDGWMYFHDAVKDLLEMSMDEFVKKYRGVKDALPEPVKQITYKPHGKSAADAE